MHIAALNIRNIRSTEGRAGSFLRIIKSTGVVDVVINKVDPTIDISYGSE